jgi:hypothetical protein
LARGTAAVKNKNNTKDQSFGINETEFCHINFDLDWPLVVRDLAHVLGGVDFLKGNKIKEEEEENAIPNTDELCKESDLLAFKNRMTSEEYGYCLNTFRVFEGKE